MQETTQARDTAELPVSPYQIVRVPTQLHLSWMDIGYKMQADKVPTPIVQQTTVSMMRKWFQSIYTTHRLCGFEEFTPGEIERMKLPIPPGFYMRIRQLSPDELKEALDIEREEADPEIQKQKEVLKGLPGVRPRYNPRWMLEGVQGYLPELREPNPEKYLH